MSLPTNAPLMKEEVSDDQSEAEIVRGGVESSVSTNHNGMYNNSYHEFAPSHVSRDQNCRLPLEAPSTFSLLQHTITASSRSLKNIACI